MAAKLTHVDFFSHPIVYDLEEPHNVWMSTLFHNSDFLPDFPLRLADVVDYGCSLWVPVVELPRLLHKYELFCTMIKAFDGFHSLSKTLALRALLT